ncbi:arrestin domain-containing protein 5 [Centrocercus urophasianus]|uniref:arrestin domain-containing protein 5 n=1 Tax=Centrocercus urophasianus TaxID=9002 RepID=UPI001C64A192|nr:arrestin domain-containing protein 5 [Centrocercus urophasianus]
MKENPDCTGANSCLDSGIHTFDFRFSFPPEVPSTFTSKAGCISYFMQGICCRHSTVLAKELRYLLLQALLVVEARTDVDYLCCFIQGSVILCISLKKNVFFPGATSVFTTDIANRTCNYIRKYELVGTSNLPCAMSTIFGKVPIIIAAIPERLWSRAS